MIRNNLDKLLWLICGLLIVSGLGLFFHNQKGWADNNRKQIIGKTINNVSINNLKLAKLPSKKSETKDPQIYAKAVYLMDGETFYPLYSKEENQKLPIASTTKIATALVVLENHGDKLRDEVKITPQMVAVEGSDIKLLPGEKMTVEDLLNGLLIMSGNDTAYALADYFGGKEKFVLEMNEKVKKIGLKNTQYQDPAGLNDSGYSTARDLAVLASYALKNKKIAEIVNVSTKTIYSVDGRISHELKNSNRMMRSEEQYYFPYAIGVKTGFTDEAGHVLVSAAQKDNHRLIAVVLNTNENTLVASAKESRKLLEWGFNNWLW